MNFAFIKNLKEKQTAYFPWTERGLLCLAVLLAYSNVWPNDFVLDDRLLISGNEFLRQWSTLPQLLTRLSFAGYRIEGGFHRPIQMLVYFIVYQAFGPSTVAFHALNVSLHAFNACLLHHFGIRAGFKKGAAFAAALLWSVHPLFTSDVAYMTSTAELLWSCFCLCGLITLLPDFTLQKVWKALIFFILALCSKESAVVFPALSAVTLFFVSNDRSKVTAYFKTWPLWLLSACYIGVWLLFLYKFNYTIIDSALNETINNSTNHTYSQNYTTSLTTRFLTSTATLPSYARLIIWPTGLHVERVSPVFPSLLAWQPATGALMVMLGLLQIFWRDTRSGVALSFGLIWFAVALSPYTGIITPTDAIISEGWMYMPTMGLFLGIAQTAAVFFEKKKNTAWLLAGSLAFLLGITTFFQNSIWRNPETLYQNILQNGGHTERIAIYMGRYYMRHGEFDKAIQNFQYQIDHPEGRPDNLQAELHLQLAMAWLHVGLDKNDVLMPDDVIYALPSCKHIPEAIGELGKVLQDNPDYYWAHIFLAEIYHFQGNNRMVDFHLKQVNAIVQRLGVQNPIAKTRNP